MKKGLLSFLLAALTLVGCQNYDDQFDELNAKILALQSELTSISAIQSAITDLNTKIAAVQSSALTAADLAGIISDLDAVQAAVANLGDVGTEVENLNAEVDEILAALDDLLAANAVINQDQTNNGIFINVIPGALIFIMVTITLMDPIIDEAPII